MATESTPVSSSCSVRSSRSAGCAPGWWCTKAYPGVGAVAADRLQGGLHVARVVHGIEDAEDVHAVFDGALDEALHHVVGVVAVAEQVLAAEQHLQRGLGHRLFQLAQADPRVLAEEADAGVKVAPPQHSSER